MCELPEVEEQVETPVATLYWVGLFLQDKAYGGPEEGGWWYNCGQLVTDPEFYTQLGMLPQAFTDSEQASAYCREMNEARNRVGLNEGRRDIDSVLSEGVYGAEVHEDILPPYYPARKPHYC
jgi:hypothetical protein